VCVCVSVTRVAPADTARLGIHNLHFSVPRIHGDITKSGMVLCACYGGGMTLCTMACADACAVLVGRVVRLNSY
jgi:hypothetical protein